MTIDSALWALAHHDTVHSDPILFKGMVLWIAFLGTLTAVLASYLSYYYGILHVGDIQALLFMHPTMAALMICMALSGATMQSFFALRVKRLTGRTWFAIIIWILALLQIGQFNVSFLQPKS